MACAEHFQLTLASENGLRLFDGRSLVQPLRSVDDVARPICQFLLRFQYGDGPDERASYGT